MKNKHLILAALLVCMALPHLSRAAGEEATATFTFGKIEVLKGDEQEWRFLEKGTRLTPDDLVRMPPFALIRLKTGDGVFLPTLPGGREVEVSLLIHEGIQRKNTIKGRRINENFEGSPAIDALPLGDPTVKDRQPTAQKAHAIKVSPEQLETLRRRLDLFSNVSDDILSFKPNLSLQPQISAVKENAAEDSYPGPNLDFARRLYSELNGVDVETLDEPHALLYAQVLRHVGIDADLAMNEKEELLVVFDSGIPSADAKRITANQRLIHKRRGYGTLWISLQFQRPQQNFTTAWYRGGRM